MNKGGFKIFIICLASVLVVTGLVIGGILLFYRKSPDDILPPDRSEEIDGSDDEWSKLY